MPPQSRISIPTPPTGAQGRQPAIAPSSLQQLQAWRSLAQTAREQRRHHRLPIELDVRFMGADGKEGVGMVKDITVGGARIETEACPPVGLPVVLYIDAIGRVEGTVVRHIYPAEQSPQTPTGFGVRFMVSAAKADRIIDKLTLLLTPLDADAGPEEHHGDDTAAANRRDHVRKFVNEPTIMTLPDGRQLPCRVLDMSLSGLSVESEERPPVGAQVQIGRSKGRVARHHESGFAVTLIHQP